MTKTCKDCGHEKELDKFTKKSGNKDGYSNFCKSCTVKQKRDYWRTPVGRMSQIFAVQVVNSRQRGHMAPSYTRAELTDWAFSNGLEAIHAAWEKSGYSKDLIPSVDRLDDNQGYSMNNIQLITWQANNEKMYSQRKSCERITKQNKKVEQLSLDGQLLNTFNSISHAGRVTGIQRVNINAMCRNSKKYHSVGGFIWRYAN